LEDIHGGISSAWEWEKSHPLIYHQSSAATTTQYTETVLDFLGQLFPQAASLQNSGVMFRLVNALDYNAEIVAENLCQCLIDLLRLILAS